MYITIAGANYYRGIEALKVGQVLVLKKDPDNIYDDESILVQSESGVKYGYVANSVHTVARGTHSAGFIYDSFEQKTKCRILFICGEKAIAELLTE